MPQVKVLGEYSAGMVLAGRCGLSCVAFAVAQWMHQRFETVRERLRDWYCAAGDKSGTRRRELDVASCFAPLLSWVLQDWTAEQLALALDATTLGQRFTVLAISVLYRSCAIPVAWVVLPATKKQAWKPHWIALLQRFASLVPPGLQVLVLADRGLYAKWLFRTICGLGWHPLLRINTGNADFQPDGSTAYCSLATLLEAPGESYAASGTIFRSRQARLCCTLLACWAEGCETGWYLLSDLPPQQAQASWYGLRNWIERGFKLSKSGGWNWQETRMLDPQRAERQWLAMAVASVYLLRHGTQQELPVSSPVASASPTADPGSPAPSTRRRILSIFRQGLILVQAALLTNTPVPHQRFVPEPWPTSPPTLVTPDSHSRPP